VRPITIIALAAAALGAARKVQLNDMTTNSFQTSDLFLSSTHHIALDWRHSMAGFCIVVAKKLR
jgi:hypothetical protein